VFVIKKLNYFFEILEIIKNLSQKLNPKNLNSKNSLQKIIFFKNTTQLDPH
jgi:hypothetical protein